MTDKNSPLPITLFSKALPLVAVLLLVGSALAGKVPPRRLVTSFAGDPTTCRALTWRTAAATPKAQVQYLVAPEDPAGLARASRIMATSSALAGLKTDLPHSHKAILSGLQPGTIYAYRVGSPSGWSEWHHFRTATAEPLPFRFIYLGDAQNGLAGGWPRSLRAAFREAPDAAFTLYTGDLVNSGHKDRLWAGWHAGAGWLAASIPTVAAAGNHGYLGGPTDASRRLTPLWPTMFADPGNGPPALHGTCWYLDHQGMRLIVLNSNEGINAQTAWLRKVLPAAGDRWKVVTFHHPLWSTKKGRDNTLLRKAWLPLFDAHRVDLVLQGHDHAYGRLVRPPQGRDRTGTVYLVSVSGTKMYDLDKGQTAGMVRTLGHLQLHQVIQVSRRRLEYRCSTVTGRLVDSFALIRDRAGLRQLITPLAKP